MLQAGITKVRNEVLCAIDSQEVAALAARAAVHPGGRGHGSSAPRLDGAIVAVGNAPTALGKLLEIARGGGPRPALVVGLPVGLVGAREAKLALLESDLCYITNTTARGGSPVAAAAVNALAALERGVNYHETEKRLSLGCYSRGRAGLLAAPALAMHISEGILPPGWAGLWFLVAAPFVFWGLRTDQPPPGGRSAPT